MTSKELFEQIKRKKSYLCVGLDTDINKIPKHLLNSKDPVFEFNKQIIDATINQSVAYKINTAFYESMGAKGWESMQKTVAYLPKDVFKIADAKRGDIGNTCEMYAKAFFEEMDFDAITLSPYMGEDSIKPFLRYPNKWVIVLALTSNQSSKDFQLLQSDDIYLYEKVLTTASKWGNSNNTMFVVGATQASALKKIRALVPNHFLLIPGVGAQGGSLQEVTHNGKNDLCGLLVNSSRGIIYAGSGEDFAIKAGEEVVKIQQEMAGYL